MKKCNYCHERKEYQHFHKDPTTADGYERRCKVCKKIIYAKRKAERIAHEPIKVTEHACIECGFLKPASAYTKNTMTVTGLHNRCKECDYAYKKQNFILKRETDPSMQKLKEIFLRAKQRAKDNGIEFNIDLNDLLPFHNMEHCVCIPSIRLDWTSDLHNNNSPTLDRIDSTKGYIKGNVRIISKLANTMKSDLTITQILELCNSLEKLLPKESTDHSVSVEERITLRAS